MDKHYTAKDYRYKRDRKALKPLIDIVNADKVLLAMIRELTTPPESHTEPLKPLKTR
jgi:hypothetical protein